MNAPGPDNPPTRPADRPIAAGARAADLLAAAAHPAPPGLRSSDEDPLQLETILGLARDFGRQLDALNRLSHESDEPEILVEAALRCADLATLAACAVPHLPADDARGGPAEAARLAADAVRALGSSIESGGEDSNGEHGKSLLKDIRSAAWRADLAARQVAGPAESDPS